ncbi:hypothetical protein pipiens_009520, partial [Culex pipiens pipiens]
DFGAGGANSDPEDVFSDALTEHQAGGKQPAQVEQEKKQKSEAKVRVRKPRAEECEVQKGGNVYVSAAISIEYPGAPVTTKYIRGENKVSCWAMREIENQKDYCIFEWLLCLDLKGYIPRYVLDTQSDLPPIRGGLQLDRLDRIRGRMSQPDRSSRQSC